MRPHGEVSMALLQAAHELAGQGGATMEELANRACVSKSVAATRIRILKYRGQLSVVGERRMAHRNRPVHLYAPSPTHG